jgi:ADP-heptose:LPS heptosyltransferase
VREVHTARHYLDLAAQVASGNDVSPDDLLPELTLPAGIGGAHGRPVEPPYALLHPGTARSEKYWLAERWGAVAAHLRDHCGLATIFTSGPGAFEQAHVSRAAPAFESPPDLMALAARVAGASFVVSCDTAVVHLASAFRIPQVALFGPTNPFHWRPMHPRAAVLSAARPEAPMTEFDPRMKGASMERISTGAVIRAIDSVLASPR